MTRNDLAALIRAHGFVFVPAMAMHSLLGELPDFATFAASWSDLPIDPYLMDGQRFRRRRHGRWRLSGDAQVQLPHAPHYQSREYNPLYGGIERWFAPLTNDSARSASLASIQRFGQTMFGQLAPDVATWMTEVHQFRIEARAGELAAPTPEGPHKDGVDFVLVLLIARHNIASGTTTILADPAGPALGSFTLTTPLDTALVEDARVFHGVTPVEPIDPACPAYRDVLVVTYRAAPTP